MKLQKHIIAREILLGSCVLFLTLLFGVGLTIRNTIFANEVSAIKSQLSESWNTFENLSLKCSTLLKNQSIYQYYKENKLTSLEDVDFYSKYSNPDNALEIYNYLKRIDMTDLEFDSFYNLYLSKSQSDSLVHYDKKLSACYSQINIYDKEIEKLENKRLDLSKILLYSLYLFCILIVIIYPFRFFVKAVIWAFNNYKRPVE